MEWDALVEKAVKDAVAVLHGPVTGSRLRVIIAKEAAASGLTFPPDPEQTFSNFLRQFDSKIIIQRRPGQDFLVVPRDQPTLLTAATAREPASRLRKDLFWMLTHIPSSTEGMPYYRRSTDVAIWVLPGSVAPEDAVPLPAATLEQEIEDRALFCRDGDLSEEVQAELATALRSTAPLGYFTQALRSFGLAQRWHVFKLNILVERLQAWASKQGVAWQDSWVERRSSTPRPMLLAGPPTIGSDLRAFFVQLADVMYDTDLSRISIPLDLVLKAWSRKS